MIHVLGTVKQTTIFGGGGGWYETKMEDFLCLLKFDLAVLNFKIFKISARFTRSRQACTFASLTGQ